VSGRAELHEEAAAQYENGIESWNEGRQEEAVANFERAIELDAAILDRPFQEGLERAQAGEFAGAEGWLWIAYLFRPEHVPTLSCLGDVLRRLGRVEDALPLLEKGVELAPNSWELHSDLALAFCDLDRFASAAKSLERAVQLHGLDARLAINLAIVRKCEGRVDEASRLTEEALRMQPDMAAARVNRAHLLLLQGQFEEGWREYEWRPKKTLPAERRLADDAWNGKSVLLHQEQGAGDLIQFIRYAAALEGASVTVSCDERFIPLMRCTKGVTEAVSWNEPTPVRDLEASILSLPAILNNDVQTLPVTYIAPDSERIAAWRQRLSAEPRMRVGLVWGGNPANPVERRRGIPLARMAPILQNANVAFYSLQQGPQKAELTGMPGAVDLSSECSDVMEAAAAMMNLDLIISTDTMPAHLAGALGRPVWLLLHYMADWRWMLDREDSPWYPTMRLFRQTRLSDWDSVVNLVAKELSRQVQ
jgi:tetratricopeptide (TPR) repeat protein